MTIATRDPSSLTAAECTSTVDDAPIILLCQQNLWVDSGFGK